jgi:hypothetical protein
VSDFYEQRISSAMTEPVVDRLQSVHVDEGGYQASTVAARPVDHVLKFVHPHPPPARAGQLVGARMPALMPSQLTFEGGTRAIDRGPLAIASGSLTIIARPSAPFGGASAKLYTQCALVG